MRFSMIVACSLTAVFLLGCTYSVHPVLNNSDLTTDIDLSGTWKLVAKDGKKKASSTFAAESHGDGAKYDISFADSEFIAEVGKIGQDRYIQMVKAELTHEAKPLLTALPVYKFAKFEIDGDTLRIYRVDDQKARRYLNKNKHNVPFVLYRPDNRVEFYVLTDETRNLQKLLAQQGTKLFADAPMVYTRRPAQPKRSDEQSDEPKSR